MEGLLVPSKGLTFDPRRIKKCEDYFQMITLGRKDLCDITSYGYACMCILFTFKYLWKRIRQVYFCRN